MSEPTKAVPVVEHTPGDGPETPDQSASSASYEPPPTLDGERPPPARFWSVRRVPAFIAALVLAGGVGILLYDIAAVRAGRPAMQWRRTLADELAKRPLDDTAVLVGAGVAVALGAWLLVLAITPGLRAVLPMRRGGDADVRAGLYRGAAAMVLRDRAMEVAGVQSVRVRVKRSKVEVRALSHFRALDDVRTDLDGTLGEGIRQLGLGHPPRLSVRVARPGRKG
ncbi:DUF6286 domain-containing protein [Streptomyces beihaiensis]|uniref:DUF6286 domain-containing protein n=1 Tax=Streptomyces beihaiensis TaxID=2984495 RepID=A0ABT3TRW0_9ACTN|nr:DUF6286 domain-containing protein [Streptomyces beihaiensis]MCX3059751.1 DUF6286 domain-containing protein [Streptomyces beihaiensis]